MKSLISFLVLALLSLSEVKGQLTCEVEKNITTGTNKVVFTISPSPQDVIAQAGLGDSKSIPALMNLLNSYSNPAMVTANAITSKIAKLISPFATVPSCRFKWATSQMFCDNVPGAILTPLCAFFGSITSIKSPITLPLPLPSAAPLPCESNNNKRWGLETVNASGAWAAGARGAGVVVANLDSGVRGTHEELRDNMRSTYNFYNAYNKNNATPVDDAGHGTHTMASICGKTVGVAPDATWIACKGCDTSGCGNEQLTDCGQWLLCPDNKAKNCTTAPHVINNSWGGGIGNTFYQPILSLMKQVGIINFFATGNSGPVCASVKSPADSNYTQFGIITVGASACDESIASFSSVGPSQAADYMGGLGVNIIGPGQNVFSAWNSNDTATNILSGTSMSCPHAAGAGAVLLSSNMKLTVDQIRDALQQTAYQNPNVTNSLSVCTSSSSSTAPYPNNVYGHGRFDVAAALDHCKSNYL